MGGSGFSDGCGFVGSSREEREIQRKKEEEALHGFVISFREKRERETERKKEEEALRKTKGKKKKRIKKEYLNEVVK